MRSRAEGHEWDWSSQQQQRCEAHCAHCRSGVLRLAPQPLNLPTLRTWGSPELRVAQRELEYKHDEALIFLSLGAGLGCLPSLEAWASLL